MSKVTSEITLLIQSAEDLRTARVSEHFSSRELSKIDAFYSTVSITLVVSLICQATYRTKAMVKTKKKIVAAFTILI